jgi:hypothetical protein
MDADFCEEKMASVALCGSASDFSPLYQRCGEKVQFGGWDGECGGRLSGLTTAESRYYSLV